MLLGGLWLQNSLCPKSYYTEQFEKYGYIRDKYDTTYNTPTPYDPSLLSIDYQIFQPQGESAAHVFLCAFNLPSLPAHTPPSPQGY